MKIHFCTNHQDRRVVNVKYKLCDECNYLRMHGVTRAEKAKQKQKEVKKKVTKSIIKVSSKQALINSKYAKICAEIDAERDLVCSGCGLYQSGDVRLSHSHIISRADCKRIGREDLIYDKNNIAFHCMDFGEHIGCHRLWESKNPMIMNQLNDFEKNMSYIKSISKDLFSKIMSK